MIKTEGNPSLSYVTPFFMPLQFMTTTINQKTVILRNVKNPFFEDKHLLIQQLNNPIILTPIKWKKREGEDTKTSYLNHTGDKV